MSSSECERQCMYLLTHARAVVKAEASGQAGECRVLPPLRVRKARLVMICLGDLLEQAAADSRLEIT